MSWQLGDAYTSSTSSMLEGSATTPADSVRSGNANIDPINIAVSSYVPTFQAPIVATSPIYPPIIAGIADLEPGESFDYDWLLGNDFLYGAGAYGAGPYSPVSASTPVVNMEVKIAATDGSPGQSFSYAAN